MSRLASFVPVWADLDSFYDSVNNGMTKVEFLKNITNFEMDDPSFSSFAVLFAGERNNYTVSEATQYQQIIDTLKGIHTKLCTAESIASLNQFLLGVTHQPIDLETIQAIQQPTVCDGLVLLQHGLLQNTLVLNKGTVEYFFTNNFSDEHLIQLNSEYAAKSFYQTVSNNYTHFSDKFQTKAFIVSAYLSTQGMLQVPQIIISSKAFEKVGHKYFSVGKTKLPKGDLMEVSDFAVELSGEVVSFNLSFWLTSVELCGLCTQVVIINE